MTTLLIAALLVLYVIVLAILFLYGLNFLYLILQAIRFNQPDPPLPSIGQPVKVTVQIPVYNERYVVEHIIDATARMKWPGEHYEIQILDDSTDDTRDIVARSVANWLAKGVSIEHIHRNERSGFKAGALANGTRWAKGEFLAVFDADFVPPPDFLERTVPHLVVDDHLAFVQTRWGHLNAGHTTLTRLQAVALDAHFGVEQFARSRSGHMFNFNGTAGVWRREAIESVDGWKARTLTEDLDLSYRVLLAGWGGLYLRDVVAPAELPPTISAFRRQQMRWAQGSIECAMFLVPQIVRASISARHKVQGIIHLSGYLLHALLFVLGLLYPLVVYAATRRPQIASLYGIGTIFGLTIFAPSAFFLYGQFALNHRRWRDIPAALAVSILGAGMMLNTMRALVRALRPGERIFERTPKWGNAEKIEKRYRLATDHTLWLEITWGTFNLGAAAYALSQGQVAIAIFSSMFAVGALYVGAQMLVDGRHYAKSLRLKLAHRPEHITRET